ncbi:vWA domain-containing protein [Tannockella kyphosi]|uniref:hypothetical protein n=1 Tax=Tannockella kyphosi TaxID=2899121 RepID=UPI0020137ED1|nr:hypothetical protein [Tannockella kyphosi]
MKKKIASIILSLILAITSIFSAPMLMNVLADDQTTGGDATENNEGISVSKTVTFSYDTDDNGLASEDSYEYTLNLDVFTTGEVSITEDETAPVDIILVLDQSTSMMWPADQAENLTYGDINISQDSTENLKNNVGIIDGEYKLITDVGSGESSYEWVQDTSITVSPIEESASVTYGDWVSETDTVTIESLLNSSNNEWTSFYKANYGYLYSESRQKDLVEAVLDFILSLETDVEHRISIVTYHNDDTTEYSLSGLVDTDGDNTLDVIEEVLSWVTETNTSSGNTYEGGNADGTTTFNLQHSTLIALGIETAEDILYDAKYDGTTTNLEELYEGTGRTQLSVIFTDGIPTQINSTGDGSDDSSASTLNNVNRALAASASMKQDGVTVFTIGMLDGVYSDYTNDANTNSTSSYYNDGYTTSNGRTTYYINDGNTFISSFLDLLSSNYVNASTYISSSFPNSSGIYDVGTATSYTISTTYAKEIASYNDDGTVKSYTEYYYPIDTNSNDVIVSDSLASVFTKVAGSLTTSATYELDQTTQVRDVMTSEFIIPENSTISLYIAYCEGKNSEEDKDYSSSLFDSGYYTWSERVLIYDQDGNTNEINENLSVTTQTVYVNDQDDSIVYYADEVSTDSNGTYIMIDGLRVDLYETQLVTVQGFDFNKYYVTTVDKDNDEANGEDFGAKLIIEFDIDPVSSTVGDNITSDGTLGGNAIDTNTSASGVYIYDSSHATSDSSGYYSLESFPVPNADIPIDVTVETTDQTIYLGNAISIVDLVEIDGESIDGNSNKYVDITYVLYQTQESNKDEYDKYTTGESSVYVAYDEEKDEYYKYALDSDSNRIELYRVYIPAGQSASSADGDSYNVDTLITPSDDTDYLVEITISPLTEGTVGTTTVESQLLRVYVLHPTIEVNNIWVDYATPVDLRQDNILSVVDPDDMSTYDTLVTDNIAWETTNSYSYDIPESTIEAPTVNFGYTARRGIEYTADEFFEIGVREDKEFYISSMTIKSSDGYSNTTRYEYSQEEVTSFGVYINKYDLEISKTVNADDYDTYSQSFIFDLSYTDAEFITSQKYYQDDNGLTVFESSDNDTVDLYIDTTGYYSGETEFAIYTNINPQDDSVLDSTYTEYYNITHQFFSETGVQNTSGNYINESNFTISYNGATYEARVLWEDEENEIPLYEATVIDYEKTLEVIIDPDMSNVETVEWTDSTGTRYYTFNVLVTDLYCGVELDIVEDTNWSWRYEPGFTTTTTTQYADYVSGDEATDLDYVTQNIYEFDITDGKVSISVYTTEVDETEVTYVIANVITEVDNSYQVRTVTYGNVQADISDYLEGFNAGNFVSIDNFITEMSEQGVYPVFDTTSVMSEDSSGNITQTTTTETSAYKIIDYDEEIVARIEGDKVGDNDGILELGEGLLGTYQNTDFEKDNYINYEYAYYLTQYTFDSIATVTTAKDGSSAMILVTNSTDYLDKNESDDYSDWTRIDTEQYTYEDNNGNFDLDSSNTTTMYAPVSAVYFDINEVDIDVYNTLMNEYWLSYSELAQNTFYELSDPR